VIHRAQETKISSLSSKKENKMTQRKIVNLDPATLKDKRVSAQAAKRRGYSTKKDKKPKTYSKPKANPNRKGRGEAVGRDPLSRSLNRNLTRSERIFGKILTANGIEYRSQAFFYDEGNKESFWVSYFFIENMKLVVFLEDPSNLTPQEVIRNYKQDEFFTKVKGFSVLRLSNHKLAVITDTDVVAQVRGTARTGVARRCDLD